MKSCRTPALHFPYIIEYNSFGKVTIPKRVKFSPPPQKRFDAERICRPLCKPLNRDFGNIIIHSLDFSPPSTLILLDNVARSLIILAPVELHSTCRNRRTCELCNIRYISYSDYSYITAEWFLYLNSRRQVCL